MGELRIFCGIEEKYRETAERMTKVGFRCVQYRPKLRPLMSVVVKMLEEAVEIPTPLNPFWHMWTVTPCTNAPSHQTQTDGTFLFGIFLSMSFLLMTPVMWKYEIEMASTLVG